ncbi:MAG: MFS transporter [Propionibacteriaceae bacterium]|jgi:DHA3 family macrolide efflux protein-like MFS transporter|nr:MFS transporter [Propionibacteriaceae bacterium]
MESTAEDRPDEPITAAEDWASWGRRIALFLVGQNLSLFGSATVAYAVIWYITLKTGSGWQYASLFIASNLAGALTTIPGGLLADRYSRKALMIGADLSVAACTLVLAIVMLSGYEELWVIILLLAARGFGGGIQSPSMMAAVPQLVPPDKLLRINSVNGSAQSLIFIGAPALAAVLLVYVPLGYIILIDVVTAAIGVTCVIFVPIPRLTPAAAPEGLRGQVAHLGEAARYALAIPALKRVVLLLVVMWVVVMPPAQMTPVLVVRLFGEEQWKLAATEILWSGGMVLGGLALAAWGGFRNRMTLILLSTALWGLLTVGIGLSPNIWVYFLVMLVYGLASPGFNVAANTSVQELIPAPLLGRTMGLVQFLMTLAAPLGLAIMGPLADVVDIRILCVICGAAGLVFVGCLSVRRGPASQLYAPVRPSP